MAKVLILEQSKSVRNNLRERLEFEGFSTEGAESVALARKMCENIGFDIIIADNPEGLAETHLPFIVLSRNNDIDSAVDAVRCGAVDFLTKPIDMNRLLKSIRKAITPPAENTATNSHSKQTRVRNSAECNTIEPIIGESEAIVHMRGLIDKVAQSDIPTIVVINKIDLTTPEALEALVEQWHERMPAARIVPVSAKENFNVGGLFDLILSMLPEGEPYYPKDTLTDKTLRFFASEIIREKIFLNYDKEVPYSVEIAIEEYREEPKIDRISATIYVTRDSQKGIIIGHKGEKLKRVGMQAREDLERFLDKKVFLQLFVKVNDDWRNNDRQLRRFGYEQE